MSKRPVVLRQCNHCGKDYEARTDSLAKGMGLYCGRACHFAVRRSSRVMLECAHCGKSFETLPCKVKDPDRGKYCSMPCYRAGRVYDVRPLAERFWEKVDKRGPDECWLWTAAVSTSGYGRFGIDSDGTMDQTHRVSWVLAFGPIPDDLHVLHTCDVRLCTNPRHLFLGTNKDNVDDKVSKGRQNRGETSPNSVLSDDQVVEMRRRFDAGGVSRHQLADDYGVHYQTVCKIVTRQRWTHLA